ncbi:hypothetical protein NQ317_019906, partial [Molorchus minor]
VYKRFVEWCDRNNVASKYSENVILAYFEQNSKIWKSLTLWRHFSMIKAMLNVENNQDIKAPDDKYLMFKVVAVMGILGASRREELCQMICTLALRPAHVNHQRLFIKYTSNKWTIQPVGINIFGKMPTDIARFLKLPNSELYTRHCFRRTSASLLADSAANLCTIKKR